MMPTPQVRAVGVAQAVAAQVVTAGQVVAVPVAVVAAPEEVVAAPEEVAQVVAVPEEVVAVPVPEAVAVLEVAVVLEVVGHRLVPAEELAVQAAQVQVHPVRASATA